MSNVIHVEEALDVHDGLYYAKIVKIEPFTDKYEPAKRIHFLLNVRGKAEGPITGLFPDKATPRNKTGTLLLATLGECFPGRAYDWDDLVGKKLWVDVRNYDTENGTFARVKRAVLPAPGSAMVTTKPLMSPAPVPQPVVENPSTGDSLDERNEGTEGMLF